MFVSIPTRSASHLPRTVIAANGDKHVPAKWVVRYWDSPHQTGRGFKATFADETAARHFFDASQRAVLEHVPAHVIPGTVKLASKGR